MFSHQKVSSAESDYPEFQSESLVFKSHNLSTKNMDSSQTPVYRKT